MRKVLPSVLARLYRYNISYIDRINAREYRWLISGKYLLKTLNITEITGGSEIFGLKSGVWNTPS